MEFENDQMFKIYNTFLNWHFAKFSGEISSKVQKLTHALLDVYQQIKSTFLPLPSKIHYMFNLRDITKVVKGLCSSKKEIY